MKKFFLSLAVFVMALCANAQTNQYFWYNGNLMMGNPIAQIDSVTFGEGELADTLHILLPRTIIKEVHDTVYITIHDTVRQNDVPEGALNGVFSVAANKKVRFSKGNLQYNAALGTHLCADGTTKQGTWRFAELQYDTIGSKNTQASAIYNGWTDLFAWGTSGWNSGANMYEPWSRSYYPSDFLIGGDYQNSITENYANADWGVYNAIQNGGNQPSLWRTLSKDEANYLFNTRPNANQLFGYATVNGTTGLIILPDDWSAPNGISFTPTTENYTTNIYSNYEWDMISSSVVFLPCGISIINTNDFAVNYPYEGDYWLSTAGPGANYAYFITFRTNLFNYAENYVNWRSDCFSVRLVQDVE